MCKIRSPTTFTGKTYYLEKEDNEMISKLLNLDNILSNMVKYLTLLSGKFWLDLHLLNSY